MKLTTTIIFLLFGISAGATDMRAGPNPGVKVVDPKAAAMNAKDVEEINDDLKAFSNKKVKVVGEVKDLIDAKAFVLESGGIFNDEIVVVGDLGLKPRPISDLKEDQKIEVTGILRTTTIVDLKKELSWDLDPQMEAELEGVKGFIVADRIAASK